MGIDVLKRRIGVNFNDNGDAKVVVWAPTAKKIELKIIDQNKLINLAADNYGFWSVVTNEIKPNSLYQLRIDEDNYYPDPASLSQPEGVHGPSQAIDLKNFNWSGPNFISHGYVTNRPGQKQSNHNCFPKTLIGDVSHQF